MEFRDLKTQYQTYQNEIDGAIQKVLMNADFIGGKEINVLEERLAEYVGVRHCITCANGTEAMTLVLMAWDIKAGDAVFVPDFTFFSTGEVVALQGATPIFVDVDKNTFNIDPQKLEIAIKAVLQKGELQPKAVIPVDLFGLPANYPEITGIARKYNLLVLEDSAQGFGGRIKGQKAGSFGDAATTSFFPAKPLGCYGDGGAIFTDNDQWAVLLNSLKVHGKGRDKYDNVRIGLNSRLDTIQAAVLNVKLSFFIEAELDAVNAIYSLYNQKLNDFVKTPEIPNGYYSSFAQYTIRLDDLSEREMLKNTLSENQIPAMIYYAKPMHQQKAFGHQYFDESDYAVTNSLCETVLSLPMHPYLQEKDIEQICNVIFKTLEK
ncbi:MAG: DegT/DnrJ/EryC1/StrS family aminotransferase [Acetobacterium sp.]|nr:DegT/DnrJ/EryC1/StrS family aminotransferase [Acetobacterium sp.]